MHRYISYSPSLGSSGEEWHLAFLWHLCEWVMMRHIFPSLLIITEPYGASETYLDPRVVCRWQDMARWDGQSSLSWFIEEFIITWSLAFNLFGEEMDC